MRLVDYLSDLALRQLSADRAPAVLAVLRDAARRQRLVGALGRACRRAWMTFELALAGPVPADATMAGDPFVRAVGAILAANPLPELAGKTHFRTQCREELQYARHQDLLAPRPPAAVDLEEAVAVWSMLRERAAVEDLAADLQRLGLENVAWLVRQRTTSDPILPVRAARVFLARAAGGDRDLAALGFIPPTGPLAALYDTMGADEHRLEALLEGRPVPPLPAPRPERRDTTPIRASGPAWKAVPPPVRAQSPAAAPAPPPMAIPVLPPAAIPVPPAAPAPIGESIPQEAAKLVRRLGLADRPLAHGDALAPYDDADRARARALLQEVARLPSHRRPATAKALSNLGRLRLVTGDYNGARLDFTAAAALAEDDAAVAWFDAYRAAVAGRRHDEALDALNQALELAPDGFAPFPLDDYEPLRVLGSSAFGVLFLCRERDGGGRVAIRALTDEAHARRVNAAVFRDAISLRQLEHPAVLRLRRWGHVDPEHSRPYLAFDPFEATTLEDHVREDGPLQFADFRELTRMLAEALRAAHARGLLHRAVAPGNVLLRRPERGSEEAGAWQLRLTGFGLSPDRAGDGAQAAWARLSPVARACAAPEQREPSASIEIGPAADVYGFGRTCCYALFRTPLPAAERWRELSSSLAGLLQACIADEPPLRPADFDAVLDALASVRPPEDAGKSTGPRLVVLRGRRRAAEYRLREGPNVIGRGGPGETLDVDLENQEGTGEALTSRRHAVLTWKGNLLTLTDLHSGNGTHVNRVRLTPGEEYPLRDRDVIHIGTVQLRLEI